MLIVLYPYMYMCIHMYIYYIYPELMGFVGFRAEAEGFRFLGLGGLEVQQQV